MITNIGLRNFKCFKNTQNIPVRPLNLFTGVNGRGKSTVLQSLLLMRQSPEHSRTTDRVVFNGSCIRLGGFDDVRNSEISQSETIEMRFNFEEGDDSVDLHYFLSKDDQDDMVAKINKVSVQSFVNGVSYAFEAIQENNSARILFNERSYPLYWKDLLFERMSDVGHPFTSIDEIVKFGRVHYVSADRLGPQDYYPKQSFSDFPNVGSKGEFTANLLSKKKADLVYEGLRLESGATHTLPDQTEAWLGEVFGGGRVKAELTDANIILMFLNSESTSRTYRPLNVGFGFSYVLPIIVSGLIARKGEVLIIENPEAHLHPAAQSELAKFLVRVSTQGIQVFIESHSEHVLNALRIAVLDKIIDSRSLNVLYFDRSEEPLIIEIPVNEDGSIENWPQGFFDQASRDFSKLFGV